MEKKYTNIKERLLFYAKNQGINIELFLTSIGMTYGSFKGKAKKGTLNSDAIVKIYTNYPEISIDWLLLGKEPMIVKKTNNKQGSSSLEIINLLKKVNALQEEKIKDLKNELSKIKKEQEPTIYSQYVAKPAVNPIVKKSKH